jgi:hypothetical protein
MRVPTKSEDYRRSLLIAEVRDLLDSLQREVWVEHGLDTFLGETYRTPKKQAANIAAGLSAASTAGKGWYVVGRAFHIYAWVNGAPDVAVKREDLLILLHKRAQKLGLKSLAYDAKWNKKYISAANGKIWDANHFEKHDGILWVAADAEYRQLALLKEAVS